VLHGEWEMYNITDDDIERIKRYSLWFIKRHNIPVRLSEDILGEANLALCVAAKEFDGDVGKTFKSYSRMCVKNAIRHFIEKEANYDKFKRKLKF